MIFEIDSLGAQTKSKPKSGIEKKTGIEKSKPKLGSTLLSSRTPPPPNKVSAKAKSISLDQLDMVAKILFV